MASFNSIIPDVAVYFVFPSSIALVAASIIFLGVLKSGSPTPKLTTSIPSFFNSPALAVKAKVSDAPIFCAFLDNII